MDILWRSLWLVLFAVLYGFLGAAAGYGVYYFAYAYDEDWKNSNIGFQVFDVICEIAVFALLAFWLSMGAFDFISDKLKLKSETRTVLEFILGSMFLETLYVFAGHFESKVQHVQSRMFGADPDEL